MVAQYDSDSIGIININNKTTTNIKCHKTLMCVKKVLINKTDEILLASGEDGGDIFILFSSTTPESSNIKKNS